MTKQEAYLNLIDAVQAWVQLEHGADHYAKDWVLLTGVQRISNANNHTEVRIDYSPNTAPYAVLGLISIGMENFTTD